VILKEGAKPSFKNYRGFPAACCISPNNVVVHGIPSKKIVLQEGDIVSIDVGAFYKGFHGDAARTLAVGKISEEAKRLIETTRECFFKGAKMAVDLNRIGDIGSAVQKCAEDAGYGVVRELVGHGVGRNLHEAPDVPNFGTAGKGVRLTKGMVIAIEPMINMGAKEVVFSQEDGWTVTTADGSLSAHYENTVAITEDGPKILTLR
jgi:methionyl aminopeptidase